MRKRRPKHNIKQAIINALYSELAAAGFALDIEGYAPYCFWVNITGGYNHQFLVSLFVDILRIQERIPSTFRGFKSTCYISRFEVDPASPDSIILFLDFFRELNAHTDH